MKCLFCPSEIDELKEIHVEDAHSRRLHGEELSKWTQITVLIYRNGGSEEIAKGHVCPKEIVSYGSVFLGLSSKKNVK